MLAAQIEERCAELVFLRNMWPQGPTQPAAWCLPTPVAVVTAPVVAADPAANVDIDTADDLFAGVADFDPTSVWGGDDEVTETIPVLGATAPAGVVPPSPRPRPTLLWISARLLHPPSLSHANGRLAVATTGRSRMNTRASVGLLVSPSPPSPTVVQPVLLASPSPPSPTVVLFPRPAHPIRELTRPLLPTPIEELVLAAAQPPTFR